VARGPRTTSNVSTACATTAVRLGLQRFNMAS